MPSSTSISVFGLGHVGIVQAACLADEGRTVIGVDVDPVRLDAIAAGHCPIVEPGLAELVERAVQTGTLRTCQSQQEAVRASEISIICVGTPAESNGKVDMRDLLHCIDGISTCLADKRGRHGVIIRSTLPVGATRTHILPRLEALAGGKNAKATCLFIPEFIREGNAVHDYRHPPKIIVGGCPDDGYALELVDQLYGGIAAPRHFVTYESAEMAKYADNCWHALKICFANEVGALASSFGVDGKGLMRLFTQDRSLNISDAYLRPGMPYGGSCLPKDVAATGWMAREQALDLPLLTAVSSSNDQHLERCVRKVLATGATRVGIWGLSFKPRTSDLRGSPSLALVERLLAAGRDLAIHDDNIEPSDLARTFRASHPDFDRAVEEGRLRIDGAEALDGCEAVILCHIAGKRIAASPGQILVHLHA